MALSNTRSQDFLVQDTQQGDQDTNRPMRLNAGSVSTPSFNVSPTGGQRQAEPRNEPADRSRQNFRTRERQIREVRPVDFTLQGVGDARRRIEADISGQAYKQEKELKETAPNVSEFLPDYQKALSGNQGAIQATGQRLQQEFTPREVQPIYSNAAASQLDFLRQPSQDAYQVALNRQRGGTYGVNALDAARLAASGVGQQGFERAREQVSGAYDVIPGITDRLQAQEAQRARDYTDVVNQLRSQITGDEAAIQEQARREIEAYRNRDVSAEIAALEQEARLQNPELNYFMGGPNLDFNPYIDRELTFAETLDDQEAQRYNVIAELLGKNPVQRMTPEAGLNREGIINALIAEARNEKTDFENSNRAAETANAQALYDLEQERIRNSTGVESLVPTGGKGKFAPIVPIKRTPRKKTWVDQGVDFFKGIF